MNLLSNAIKYNQRGGDVWITAQGRADEIEVTLRDTGCGIAPEDLPNVFDRFFRSQMTGDEAVEGTGLGLSIVKSIVEQHGGRVWVESVIDEGTTFSFVLPRLAPSRGSSDQREPPSEPLDAPETFPHDHSDPGGEEIDAVDDNFQEPPAARDDDEAANAGAR